MRNKFLLPTGFTLIELMIVVAIIGVLAAIAFPSYQEHVMRSRRADAKGVLLEAAQFMERIYTERGAYNKDSDGAVKTTLTLLGMPTSLQTAPKNGTTKYYNIQPLGNTFTGNLTKDVYTLQAAPIAGTAQANDKCGTLTISNTGAKGLVGQATGITVDECWNR